MNKRKVFITGELGMTAMALEKALQDDYELVWSANNRDNALCTFPSVYGQGNELDICKSRILSQLIKDREPDIIIHVAGMVDTKLCEQRPEQASKSNVYGSWVVANIAKKYNCKLVYFSTTAIYDTNKYSISYPIVEDSPKNPQTLYGITKYSGEMICNRVMDAKDLLIVRPCFMFGGKIDHHSAVSKAVRSALFENEYDIFLDPDLLKDFMHVDDGVAAIKHLLYNNCYGDYNISRGGPIQFKEYVSMVEEITGKNVKFTYFPEADYLHNHIVLNGKLRATGWKPKISIEDGIKMIIEDIASD